MSVTPVTTPPPLTWGPNALPVPYAAAWSAETSALRTLTASPDHTGLAYQDETPADRDRHGVLWARLRHAPGEGRPRYRALHSERQRRAMYERLCQVCGGPAGRTSQGWLFLTQAADAADALPNWPEGALSTKPPVCPPCAALALRHCPYLDSPVAIRSRKPRVWGVFGGFFTLTADGGRRSRPHRRLPSLRAPGGPLVPGIPAGRRTHPLHRGTDRPVISARPSSRPIQPSRGRTGARVLTRL
jgi:hypothetical protein